MTQTHERGYICFKNADMNKMLPLKKVRRKSACWVIFRVNILSFHFFQRICGFNKVLLKILKN